MLTLDPKQSPKKLPETRLEELAAKVKDGSIVIEEKEELTSGFVRLVSHLAFKFARGNYTKYEDYFSCGLFGIAYGLKHAQEKLTDQNIGRWLVYCIKEHMRRFRQRDFMIPIPSSTYKKAKRDGKELTGLTIQSIEKREPCSELGNIYELKDILSLCALDELDRGIICLRSQGYKDVEIADKLGISKTAVNNKRNELEARFDAMLMENM